MTKKWLTLDDLDLHDHLCLFAAWWPHEVSPNPRRWSSWRAYLGEFEALRLEVLAEYGGDNGFVFAERVRGFVKAHGLAALDAIGSYEELRIAIGLPD